MNNHATLITLIEILILHLWASWNMHLCPYPSYNWARPNLANNTQQPGLLSSRPQQAVRCTAQSNRHKTRYAHSEYDSL